MILNWKQKILLYILNKGEELSRLKLFKLAFLLSREIDFYDFVPYKFGPYSFEMDKDIRIFHQRGWINMKAQTILLNDLTNKLLLNYNYENCLVKIIDYFQWEEKDLLNYIYENYSYYTQNSQIKKVAYKRKNPPIAIYSIGYQGLSIDAFIDILVKKGIKTVLDVRHKPLSYKYGFNIFWLRKYLPEFGIKYLNIPELGIEDRIRRSCTKRTLWKFYIKNLEKKGELVQKTIDRITFEPTVLMCFEINPNDCHRFQLSKKIQQLTGLPIIDYNKGFRKWKKLS